MASHGVTVNAVAPGPIKTKMLDIWSEDVKEKFRKLIPLGYFGCPDDVAETVLFLVSDGAKYPTGETINVNGGALMD